MSKIFDTSGLERLAVWPDHDLNHMNRTVLSFPYCDESVNSHVLHQRQSLYPQIRPLASYLLHTFAFCIEQITISCKTVVGKATKDKDGLLV